MAQYPTNTYWSCDGISLQNYAWNIETLGGARLALPPPRGDNIKIPYLYGQRYISKMPDQRTLTLGMWIIGADMNGNPPTDMTLQQQFEANYRQLRRIFWQYTHQMDLTKRFLDDDGNVVTATAQAEFAGGLEIEHEGGPYRGKFTVDLLLADPFFYGAAETVSPAAWNADSTVTILGDYASIKGTLTLVATATCTNPKFTLGTNWVQINATLASGSHLTLDLESFNAYYAPSGGGATNINNVVTRSSPRLWLAAQRGEQLIRADGGSGARPVISYQPAYL